MTHLVKQIYDFFKQNPKHQDEGKNVSLLDFLETLPEIKYKATDSPHKIDMGIVNQISSLCKKMVQDTLLIPVETNPMICLPDVYISIEPNLEDYEGFIKELDYGTYDFKYQGFVYIRNWFEQSIIPITGVKKNNNEDMGTAYYIGNNMFVTAAHCVNELDQFNLLLNDTTPIRLKEVWFAERKDPHPYDLAIIITEEQIDIPSFMLDEASILTPVLVIGYPPIPGMFPIQTAETASVGAYVRPNQKAAVGQVVTPTKSYLSHLDHFIINARVKGGNSGGPVINEYGKVIGTVVEIPFDSQGGSEGGRYDIMGYGICLPSKYIDGLIKKHTVTSLRCQGKYFTATK